MNRSRLKGRLSSFDRTLIEVLLIVKEEVKLKVEIKVVKWGSRFRMSNKKHLSVMTFLVRLMKARIIKRPFQHFMVTFTSFKLPLKALKEAKMLF